MVVCRERKELSKNAVSAVENVNAARSLAVQESTQDLAHLWNALGSAQSIEREALEQLVLHRKQHGC
jgi:hypothetical protein